MPKIKSAKKALRQSLKRYDRNTTLRRRVKESVKDFGRLVKEGKKADAAKMLPTVFSVIDKAAKNKIFHKNNASRKKSQLAKLVS